MKKRILSLLLTVSMVLSLFPTSAFAVGTTSGFSDMPSNWSTKALENAVDNGLLKGDNGKILPNANLTRAQMATIVNRAFGTTEKASLSSYTDVAVNAWYCEDMAKAVQMKTFVGSGDKLNPDSNITREEAFAVLTRAIKLSGANQSVLDKFLDKALVSSWAEDATASLVSAGYIAGSNGQLNPKQNITRAEFAQIMDNLLKNHIKTSGTYTTDYTGNMMINVPGVTLKNITISGDLIIGDGVGNGDVTLDNVVVTGRTVIRGGGVNSIKIIGKSNIQNIVIARVDGQVRVYVEDGTQIGDVIVDGYDDVTIEGNFGAVTVTAPDITVTATNADIVAATIDGDRSIIIVSDKSTIKTATIEGDNAKVITLTGAKIGAIIANGEGITISGTGTVGAVEANGNNTAVTTPGTSVTAAPGSTGNTAGDKPVTDGATERVPIIVEGGVSSGSGNGNSSIAVRAITVTGTAITVVKGNTLQMSATVTPINATNKIVTWSAINGTGAATIDATGLLTAIGVGTVTVKATNEASGVTGTKVITVTQTADPGEIDQAAADAMDALIAALPEAGTVTLLDKADIEAAKEAYDSLTPEQVALMKKDEATIIAAEDELAALVVAANQAATAAVVKAEGSKLKADVDAAQALVTALEDGADKTGLQERITAIKVVDPTALETATAAVVKAEGSKLKADVDAAQALVTALEDGADKTGLQERITAIKVVDPTALETATAAVVKAEGSKLKADVDAAQALVTALEDGADKTGLQKRIDAIKVPAQTLAEAKIAAEGALTKFTATNETTEQNILDAVKAVITNKNITSAFTVAFNKKDAAVGTAGTVTGTITLTLAGTPATTVTVEVNKVIAALPAASVDKTAIDTAITAATNAKKDVVISTDGKDVAPETKWVTSAVDAALATAIQTATDAKTTVTTDLEVTAAATALDDAVGTYNTAKKAGTKAVVKTALTNAIAAAGTNKGTAKVSADGTDVFSTNKWVTTEVMTAYTVAIAAAQAIADKADATEPEVYKAVATLATATLAFDTAKKAGMNVNMDMVTVGVLNWKYTIPTGPEDETTAIVTGGYEMATTETTYNLWYAVREWAIKPANGYTFQNQGREGSAGASFMPQQTANPQPVTSVNWRDTIVWLNAYSEMTGLQPVYRDASGNVIKNSTKTVETLIDINKMTGKNGYRLPNRMEWEMAARWRGSDNTNTVSGYTNPYFTKGNSASGATAVYANEVTLDYAVYGVAATASVGTKKPNTLGLKDMSGNVWEWSFDILPNWEPQYRGIHGSSFENTDISCMQVGTNYAGEGAMPIAYYSYGFRIARTK